MEVGLESFSLSFGAGFAMPGVQREHSPYTFDDLLARAAQHGLAGLSFPVERLLPEAVAGDERVIADARRQADRKGLFLNVASSGSDPEKLGRVLRAAQALGCTVVRTVIGGAKIGGDRRSMRGAWSAFMDQTLANLQALAPIAEDTGVALALENHQDLTSDELIALLRAVGSPALGILLDVANPLGTAEAPEGFYAKVMPFIKGAHLKDYTIHLTPSGYRLARCALGSGVVDFPGLFARFEQWHPQLRCTIELAAWEARHVRVLEDDFWPDYPPRPARELAATWRFVHRHAADTNAEWRTPAERGEDAKRLLEYEDAQLQESVAYIQGMLARRDS